MKLPRHIPPRFYSPRPRRRLYISTRGTRLRSSPDTSPPPPPPPPFSSYPHARVVATQQKLARSSSTAAEFARGRKDVWRRDHLRAHPAARPRGLWQQAGPLRRGLLAAELRRRSSRPRARRRIVPTRPRAGQEAGAQDDVPWHPSAAVGQVGGRDPRPGQGRAGLARHLRHRRGGRSRLRPRRAPHPRGQGQGQLPQRGPAARPRCPGDGGDEQGAHGLRRRHGLLPPAHVRARWRAGDSGAGGGAHGGVRAPAAAAGAPGRGDGAVELRYHQHARADVIDREIVCPAALLLKLVAAGSPLFPICF